MALDVFSIPQTLAIFFVGWHYPQKTWIAVALARRVKILDYLLCLPYTECGAGHFALYWVWWPLWQWFLISETTEQLIKVARVRHGTIYALNARQKTKLFSIHSYNLDWANPVWDSWGKKSVLNWIRDWGRPTTILKRRKKHKFLQTSDFVGHISFCGFLAMTNMVNISSM